MRIDGFRWMTAGLALALGMATVSGCGSKSGFTAEMRKQSQDMVAESAQWEDQLKAWSSSEEEIKDWQEKQPASSKDAARQGKVNDLAQKLKDHEFRVSQFKEDVDQVRAKLEEESSKPESERAMNHAGLWAEHLKLKATFSQLAQAHKSLEEDYATLTNGSRPKEG